MVMFLMIKWDCPCGFGDLPLDCCHCSVAKSCPTLRPHGLCCLSGSSVHEIFQARILEWVAISFSRGSSGTRDQTCIFHGRWILYHWTTREALCPNTEKKSPCTLSQRRTLSNSSHARGWFRENMRLVMLYSRQLFLYATSVASDYFCESWFLSKF